MSRSYLTLADVAVRYGGAYSRSQLYELTRTGRIPHRKLAGCRELLFLEAELEAWEDGAPLETVKASKGGRVVRPTPRAR